MQSHENSHENFPSEEQNLHDEVGLLNQIDELGIQNDIEKDDKITKHILKDGQEDLSNGHHKNGEENGLNSDFDESRAKKEKFHFEIDEEKAKAGFQNIGNISRFHKASQIMGTRRSLLNLKNHQNVSKIAFFPSNLSRSKALQDGLNR